MTKTTAGWTIFILALGMMCGLLAVDLASIPTWDSAAKPAFVASFLGHVSATIAAFFGGKLIPETRDSSERGRAEDSKIITTEGKV